MRLFSGNSQINGAIRSIVGLCIIAGLALPARAEDFPNATPPELQGVGIFEHLGKDVSINDLHFKDETGAPVALAQYFQSKRPVILNLIYFECPNLCNYLLNGLVKSMKSMEWTPGQQFDIISVSINPLDTAAVGAQKKANYLKEYGRPEAAAGWHFLTGTEGEIKRLADQVGFGFKYDERQKQYAHSAALFVLTPEGKISRYLYGIEFRPQDLKLSLLEASNGKVGTIVDRLLLFCYRYDPASRKYSVYLANVMQTAAAGMVLFLGGFLFFFWRRERRLVGPAGIFGAKGTKPGSGAQGG